MSVHLQRPRLTHPVRNARVVAIESGAATGKTALAAEMAATQGRVAIPVPWRGARTQDALVSVVGTEIARVLDDETAPVGADLERIWSLLDSLDDPAALVFDDLHRARSSVVDDIWKLLDELLDGAGGSHQAIVCGRGLPAGDPDLFVRLSDDDLRLRRDETVALAELHGVPAARAVEVHAACEGWVGPSASVLSDPDAPSGRAVQAVQDAVTQVLDRLDDSDQHGLGQLARIDSIHRSAIADAGLDELFATGRRAGLVTTAPSGHHVALASVFRDRLRTTTASDAALLETLAGAAARTGDVAAAVTLLRTELPRGGQLAVAKMLASLPPDLLLRLPPDELATIVEELEDDQLRRHPGALIVLSRSASLHNDPVRLKKAQERLAALGDERVDAILAADAALAGANRRGAGDAEMLSALREQREATADPEVRARLSHAIARCAPLSEPSEVGMARWFDAEQDWEAAGYQSFAAMALVEGAMLGARARGDVVVAVDLLTRARERALQLPVVLVTAGTFLATGLLDLGRNEDAEAELDQVEPVAHALGSPSRIAMVDWFRARLAARRGDADAVLAAVRRVEAREDAVVDRSGGAYFAAEAARLLDQVGNRAEADERMARAVAADDGTDVGIGVAHLVVTARRGDLDAALAIEADLATRPRELEPDEHAIVRLMLAHAARTDDDDRARQWAAEAFDLAGALGEPHMLVGVEPAIAWSLLPEAATGGSSVARQLLADGVVTIHDLGTFDIGPPGLVIRTPTGVPASVLKFVAMRGGRAHADQVIDAVWPDASEELGRRRLRVALSRLRNDVGHLVVRDDGVLRLVDGVVVDSVRFDREVDQALHDDDLAAVRRALERRRGPFLADDLDAEWTWAERDRLDLRYRMLLDHAATLAETAGSLGSAIALLQRAARHDLLDEAAARRTARLLSDLGYRAAARNVLENTIRALHEDGLRPSAGLLSDVTAIGE